MAIIQMNMKNINIAKSFAALLLGLVSLFTSCEGEDKLPGSDVTPVFPENVITENIQPGEVVSLSFTANMDWKASISGEGYGSRFWIDDDGVKASQIFGNAGDCSVTIVFSDSDDFETLTCEVNLTMGGETKKIAVYTGSPAERSLTLYIGKPGEYDFVKEDRKYVYSEEAVSEVSLTTFPEVPTYKMPVKVVADFPWRLAVPEWVEADVYEGEEGTTEIMISGVLYVEEATGAEGMLKFYDASGLELQEEVKVTLPSFNDRIEFNINSLTFNKEAHVLMPTGSFSEEPMPAIAYLLATDGAAMKAFSWTGEGHSGEYAEWVVMTPSYDPSAGLLQTYSVEITVPVNEGPERYADIFAFPETLSHVKPEDICNPQDASCIKEEFMKYHVGRLKQEGIIPPYITPRSSEELMAEVGTSFAVLQADGEDNPMQWDFPGAPGYFAFTYTSEYSHEQAAFDCTSEYAYCRMFDDEDYPNGMFVTETPADQCWIRLAPMNGNKAGRFNIVSLPEESTQTAAIFYNDKDEILAAVLIKYIASGSEDVTEPLVISLTSGEAQLTKYGEDNDYYYFFESEYGVKESYLLETSDKLIGLSGSRVPASVTVNNTSGVIYENAPFVFTAQETSFTLQMNDDVADPVEAYIVLKDDNMLGLAVIHLKYTPAPDEGGNEGGEEGGEGGSEGGNEGGEEGGEGGNEGGEGGNEGGEEGGNEGGEGGNEGGEGGEGGSEGGNEGGEEGGEGGGDIDIDVPIVVDPSVIFTLEVGTAELLKLDADSDILKKVYKKYATTQVYQVTTISRSTSLLLSSSYEIFGGVMLDPSTLEEISGGPLSMEPMSQNIVMYSGGATTRQEAIYILNGSDGNTFAAIHYIFDPDADIYIEPAFEFYYPDRVSGAELNRYTGSDLQSYLDEFQGVEAHNVYELVYTVASPTRPHIVVPSMPVFDAAWGNESMSSTYWLTYVKVSSNVINIKMTQSGLVDKFVFKTSDGMFSHILICTYRPAN